MNLRLDRDWPLLDRTIGRLYVEDTFFAFTCEDRIRHGPKVKGQTAIPAGTYSVVITYSPKFQRDLPLVKDVPGFEGIRFHPGNTEADTEGCILVGWTKDSGGVYDSRKAFDALFMRLSVAFKKNDPITLTIAEPVPFDLAA